MGREYCIEGIECQIALEVLNLELQAGTLAGTPREHHIERSYRKYQIDSVRIENMRKGVSDIRYWISDRVY